LLGEQQSNSNAEGYTCAGDQRNFREGEYFYLHLIRIRKYHAVRLRVCGERHKPTPTLQNQLPSLLFRIFALSQLGATL